MAHRNPFNPAHHSHGPIPTHERSGNDVGHFVDRASRHHVRQPVMSLARFAAEAAFSAMAAPKASLPDVREQEPVGILRLPVVAATADLVAAGSNVRTETRSPRVFRVDPAGAAPNHAAPSTSAAGTAAAPASTPLRSSNRRNGEHLPTSGRVIYAAPTAPSGVLVEPALPNHGVTSLADRLSRLETEPDAGALILAGLDAALKESTVKTYENVIKQALALQQDLASSAAANF